MTKKFAVNVLALGLAGVAQAAPVKKNETVQFAKGRILIEPRAGLSPHELDKILSQHGGKKKKIGQTNIHIVELPANASEKDVVAKLSKNPHIKFAELDVAVKANSSTNDPNVGSQWYIPKIGVPSAWDIAQGEGVTIAILDSGVNAAHPDLAANIVPGYNSSLNNTDTADVCGHGTAVAGSAAPVSNNGIGIAGVAGKAKIMPVRIADMTSTGCYGYYSTMAAGINYAADHGARIANLSYSGVSSSSSIQSAAQYLRSKGGLLFVSAGNTGADLGYAPTNTMVVVSATDSTDNKASFSSFGAVVTLAAPGAYIYTTNNGLSYSNWNGTSFASPIAAGVGALMMSARPDLSPSQIESLLYSSAVDAGAAGRDPYFGYGIVDAAAAVNAALHATATDTVAPSVAISNPLSGASVSGLVPVNVSASDNVGVTQVELKVNGTTVAIDNSAPYAFSWDSKGVANGSATLIATAKDAQGNAKSASISVNVNNVVTTPTTDTVAPVVTISNPVSGQVSGNVNVSVYATDNSGAAGITQTILIDGVVKATGTGGSLSYSWNTRKVSIGQHKIEARAKDAAGNVSSTSVLVTR